MGIYIEGMKMPKSCGYCPLRHEARDGDECYLGASLTEYQKRPYDCPLIPIPPHGDLIDRNWLIEKFKGVLPLHFYVENAPAIIEAEEGE